MNPIRRILCPIDFSEASAAGLRYAETVADEFDARMDLLFVVEPPRYPSWGYAHLVLRDQDLLEEAAVRMPEFVRLSGLRRTRMDAALFRAGDADSEIVKAATEQGSDLIVMASHGLGGVKHALIGSTTERVVRHAPCSVLTIREKALAQAAPPRSFRASHILLPTDLSEDSKPAFAAASDLARRFQASILALTVIAEHLPTTLGELGYVVEIHRAVDAARRELPLLVEKSVAPGVRCDIEVTEGSPAHVICEVARSRNIDLIIMNTHRRSGPAHLLIGSVTERVVRHAPCSVWILRDKM